MLIDLNVDDTIFDAVYELQISALRLEVSEDLHHDISPDVEQLIERAYQEARWLDHNYVGTEHLLLGLCRGKGTAAIEIIIGLGVQPGEICKEVINLLGAGTEKWKDHHPEIDFQNGIELYVFQ